MARGQSRAQSEATPSPSIAERMAKLQEKYKAGYEAQRTAAKPIIERNKQISRAAYAAIPAGTELPFGKIGDDLTPENFFEKFDEYMTDDGMNVPGELQELNPNLEETLEASQRNSEPDEDGDPIPERYYVAKDKGGNTVYKRFKNDGVQGTSREENVVVNIPVSGGGNPIKVEMTYDVTTQYEPYQDDDVYGGTNWSGSTQINIKGIKVV